MQVKMKVIHVPVSVYTQWPTPDIICKCTSNFVVFTVTTCKDHFLHQLMHMVPFLRRLYILKCPSSHFASLKIVLEIFRIFILVCCFTVIHSVQQDSDSDSVFLSCW